MPDHVDAMTEMQLTAYVDGQLDDWQAAEVEAWLARHPDRAAAVMQDIRLQRELRLALSGSLGAGAPPQAITRASARLARGLHRDRLLRHSLRLLPVALLAGLGWLVWAGLAPLGVTSVNASVGQPDFVKAALAARQASEIRLPMRSMIEDPDLDTEELRAATGILLPAFDPDWAILDAQVFPSPQGPGVVIVFDTPRLGRVYHFAVRPGDIAVKLPRSAFSGGSPLSWFQIGETAHVLIAERGGTAPLARAAEAQAESLQ